MDSIKAMISDNLAGAEALTPKVLSSVKAGGTFILAILINMALIPVVMFYLLRDWNIILARIEELTPRRWLAKLRTVAVEVDDVLAEFLRGQFSVMIVLATYYVIGLGSRACSSSCNRDPDWPGCSCPRRLRSRPRPGVLAALLQWHGLPGFVAVLVVYGVGQLLRLCAGAVAGRHRIGLIRWRSFSRCRLRPAVGFAGVLLALPARRWLVALRHLRKA
jgi:hypothetical protein